MWLIFLSALLFGLTFCASPGAVFSETLRRGLAGGFRPALLVQFGSLIGDASWALIGLSSLALLLAQEQIRIPLTLASAAYLAWLGWQGLRDAWRPSVSEDAEQAARNAFAAGALLSLSNPKNLVFWGALGGALAGIVEGAPSMAQMAVFFAGFMLAALIWSFVCAALVDWLRRHSTPRWQRISYAGCGLLLLAMAGLTLRGL